MSKDVKVIYPQIHPAGPGSAGEVIEAHYYLDSDTITLCEQDGEAVRDEYGSPIVHYLEPGEDARRVAFRLAKSHWRKTTDQEGNDFNRPLGTTTQRW